MASGYTDTITSEDDWARYFNYERQINQALADDPLLHDEGGATIRLCGQPLFLPLEVIETIQVAAEVIWHAAEKAVSHIVSQRRYVPYFRPQQAFATLNETARAFPHSLYLSRFDFRLREGMRPNFIEFNTTCPGGPAFFSKWRTLVLENYPLRDLSSELGRFELDSQLAFPAGLVDIARSYYGRTQPTLHIAIINDDTNLSWELDYIGRLFEMLGHKAEITHVEMLKYDGTFLRGPAKRPLDLVYCKIWPIFSVNRGWQIEQFTAYRDFLKAIASDRLCIMNPMPAMTVGEDKALVALLSQGYFDAILNEEERAAVRTYLPCTALLGIMDDNAVEEAIEQKDARVLKPRQEMRGHYVYFGKDFSDTEWRQMLIARRNEEAWIVQEFLPSLGQNIPREVDERVTMMPVSETLTAFLMGEQFVGVWSRVSETALNNLHSGGAVQCVVSSDA